MKNFFNCLFALCLSVTTIAFPANTLFAAGQNSSGAQSAAAKDATSQVVDAWGWVNENVVQPQLNNAGTVKDVMEGVLEAGGKEADDLVDILGDLGMKGAPKEILGQLKGLGSALKIVGYVINASTTAAKVYDAYRTGDAEKFKQSMADFIIDTTAGLIGDAVGTATTAAITAAGWGVSAPVAVLAGVAAGKGTEELVKAGLNKFARQYIEQLMQNIWDKTHEKDSNQVSPGDLEGLGGDGSGGGNKGPNGGGKKSTYQKPQGIKAHQWGTK